MPTRGVQVLRSGADLHSVTTRITRPTPAARFVVPAAMATGAVYLGWRLGWTRSGASPWLFWPLWLAEVTVFLGLVRLSFEMWTLRSEHAEVRCGAEDDPALSVDVVVVCADEPIEVLRASLHACAAIRGSHRTIALDTIGRPELAELASETDAVHLVTSAGADCAPEEHLNAALEHLDGDLVTVLHGNDVPLPNLIEELCGDFADASVWLAQGRQAVHGSSRGEHHGTAGQLSYFFSVVQPGKAHHGASYWCGSGGVVRRSALDRLGGVPTGTCTPAYRLSLRAHRAGWRSTYHDEPVVLALAGPGVRRYLARRTAWAKGILGSLRGHDSPLRPGGLNRSQRMSYLGTCLHYLGGPRRATLVAVVVATLATGALPVVADGVLLASAWGLWIGMLVLARRALTRDDRGELAALCEQWLLMEAHCRGWAALLSPPESQHRRSEGHLREPMPLLLPVLCAVAVTTALAVRLMTLSGVPLAVPMNSTAMVLAIAAGVAVLLLLVSALARAGFAWPAREASFTVTASAELAGQSVPLVELDDAGATVALRSRPAKGTQFMVGLFIPGLDGRVHRATVAAEVCAVRPNPTAELGNLAEVRFTRMSRTAHERLTEYRRVLLPARVAALDASGGSDPDPSLGQVRPGGSISPALARAVQADAVSAESAGNSPAANQRASRISADRGDASSAEAS